MNKYYRILVLVLIGLFSGAAVAGDYGKGQMKPLDYERLSQPIALNGACSKIKIFEWRPTPGHVNSTSISKYAVNKVNVTCNLAVQHFFSFIDSTGRYRISPETRRMQFHTSLSFMPADMSRSGAAPRNLNDLRYRFTNRTLRNPLWGYVHRDLDWAFIRNDVLTDDGSLNRGFVIVTAHELFHTMSNATGIYYQHQPQSERDSIDEEMAQDFTEYLGLGR